MDDKTKLQELAKTVGDDWAQGEYYDEAETAMSVQWEHLVWPIICNADFSRTLDLAAGHGRNTALLLKHAAQIIAVDINDTNIEYLTKRFINNKNLELAKNNGFDLREIDGSSISFVYSFDAMVHFDSDIVHNYIKEFRRIMKPGAKGFCHYSNNYHNPTGTYRDHPGWRNFMSKQLFEHWLTKEGFEILASHYVIGSQLIIPDDNRDCDAVTLFRLPETAQPMSSFINFTDTDFDALRIKLQQTEKQLSDLRNSTFWRATQPLRWAVNKIRG